jgi:hyperosmotically inducible protein
MWLLRALPLMALLAIGCARSDASVAADVKSRLKADPATASSQIDVTVSHGEARLTGVADSPAQRERAFTVARSVKGVTSVENDIRFADAKLVQDVKQALAGDPVVGTIPIEVQSTNGVVSLVSDKTNQDERTRIVQIARAVPGVLSVEDNMK